MKWHPNHNEKLLLSIVAISLVLIGSMAFQLARSIDTGSLTDVYVYPPFGEADYTIGRYNSTYYFAKNVTTGNYDYLGTSATTTIQYALNNGNTTYIMPETYLITSTIFVPSYAVICNRGTLEEANSANCNIFNLTSVVNVEIYGGQLFGNNGHNTAGMGICIDTPAYSQDSLNYIHDIYIYNFSQYGLGIFQNTRVVTLRNVDVYWCSSYGFYIGGGDHFISECEAGQNTGIGFFLTAVGGDQLSNCKAYGSSYSGGFGDGFLISGDRDNLVNCYAQENYRHGFLIYTTQPTIYGKFNTLTNCIGEANNFAGSLNGVGIRLDNVNNNTITGGVFTSQISANQYGGIWIANTSAGNIINGPDCLGNSNFALALDANATGQGNIIKHVLGFVTENGGEVSGISSSGTFNHGLAGTPTFVELTPKGTSPETIWGWSYNAGSTTITVYFNSTNPTMTFSWYAQYNP